MKLNYKTVFKTEKEIIGRDGQGLFYSKLAGGQFIMLVQRLDISEDDIIKYIKEKNGIKD